MNRHRSIANANHEDVTRFTSRDFRGRPVPHALKRSKRVRNRAAKRADARWHCEAQ